MAGDIFFSDGAVNVAIADGMIRMEFGVLSFHEKAADGKPKVLHQATVVMTPQGFARTFGNMDRALNALVENGIIPSRDSRAVPPGPAGNTETVIENRERRAFGTDGSGGL